MKYLPLIVLLSLLTATGIVCVSTENSEIESLDSEKVDEELADLYRKYSAFVDEHGSDANFDADPGLAVRDSLVLIDATAENENRAAVLLQDLMSLGLQDGSTYQRLVSGWLPIRSIEQVVHLEHLEYVRSSGRSTGRG